MYRWFWSFVRPDRFLLLFAYALTAVVSALAMVNPTLMGALVDQVIIGGRHPILGPILGLLFGATVVRMAVRWFFVMIFEHSSQRLVKAMREDLFHHLQGLDYRFFDKTRTGDLMALMTSDLDACRHMISWVSYQTVENFLVFAFSITVLFFHHPWLTLALTTMVPPIAWFAWRLAKGVRPLYGKVREAFSRLNSVVQENIAGNRIVKAFVREDEEIRKFSQENDGYRAANIKAASIWGKYIPLIEGASGMIMVIMLLGGGWLIMEGQLTVGTLVTFTGLIWAITQPLRMAGWLVNDAQRFVASLERLYALRQEASAIKAAEVPLVGAEAGPPQPIRGHIEFQKVNFSYGDEAILHDISFAALPGQTIGVVGPTGSGKSTLLRLLARYYDVQEGSVAIDGRDLRDWPLEQIRAGVGYAMQDVFLFSDTLEGNIVFGRPDATLEEAKVAATQARAAEFIDRMPEGYDTIVGERGIGLSGGQKQRVALARLLLADPPVMVLDDTTSAVDLDTERHLQETMRHLHGAKTLFIVAHRFSTIQHADLILVLEDGRITQRGTHQELIASPGWYRTVWLHQLGQED